jgi:hypothetical protein
MASDDRQTDAQLIESLRWYVETDDNPLKSEDMSDAADRLEQYRNEVTSVLELLDRLASQWGDGRWFRRCRDRLRRLVK